MQLRIVRWGDDPSLSSWMQCNNKYPYKGKKEVGESEDEMQNGSRDQNDGVTSFEYERGPQANEYGPRGAGKVRKWIFPQSLWKES